MGGPKGGGGAKQADEANEKKHKQFLGGPERALDNNGRRERKMDRQRKVSLCFNNPEHA